jgi:hypothetical protein
MAKKNKVDPATGVETETEATEKVWIVAKQDSRMRCGQQFTREAREAELTEEELKQIIADPMLAIVPSPEALAKAAGDAA